jgi:hypothetical protein
MTKEQVGTNPDGSPHFLYTYACDHGCEANGGACTGGLLLTGPISGTVGLKDGTLYSVTPDVIEHGPGHSGQILHHIEKMHEKASTFTNVDGSPFKHVCTEACGPEADAPVAS